MTRGSKSIIIKTQTYVRIFIIKEKGRKQENRKKSLLPRKPRIGMVTIIPLQSVSRCEGRAMIQDREKKGIEKKREDQRSLLSELYEAFNRDNRFERRNKTRMRQMRSEVIFQTVKSKNICDLYHHAVAKNRIKTVRERGERSG